MADSLARRNARLTRLRHRLKEKKESLADQFDFRMYIIFHFKEKKPAAIYEVDEVMTVMTNNYEEFIMQEAKDDAFTMVSSQELLDKDVVQLHASKWHSLRKDVLGVTSDVDFFLWPRADIGQIECIVFSRWKGEPGPYRPLHTDFHFNREDYEHQITSVNGQHSHDGLIFTNPEQTLFLFVDRFNIQTKNKAETIFKLSSFCVYLPQDMLLSWQPESLEEVLKRYQEL